MLRVPLGLPGALLGSGSEKGLRRDGRIVFRIESDFMSEQAIIRTGGKQYRVEVGSTLRVEKLVADVGATVDFGEVLFVGSGGKAKVGTPLVAGAKVAAEVTKHGRGKKLIVYKFRRRKNYRRKAGHRQAFTEIKITAISA